MVFTLLKEKRTGFIHDDKQDETDNAALVFAHIAICMRNLGRR
jgi:hypothetical protein